MNVQLFLVWTKESFQLQNGPSRNSTMSSSRRSEDVLFCDQDSEEFSGILYSVVKKVTFLKGNLLCINVLQTFYKFCHWRQRKISNYIRICDRFCIEICIVFIRLTSQSSNNKIFKNNFSVYCFRGTQRLFSVKYLFGEAKIAQNFLQLEEG